MRAAPIQLLQAVKFIPSYLSRSVEGVTRFTSSATPAPLLYRDFIQQSLYHPELGYFNKPQPPICRLTEPINFNRILNQAEYQLVLSRVYKQLQVDWLTPVEVFAPWYGRAIAHYILEVRKHTLNTAHQPLAIIEVGGGTGTLAASILDYIAEREPVTYSAMTYSTIELSSSLAAAQQDLVVQQRGHSTAWRCIHGDAATPQAWADVAAAAAQKRQHHQHHQQQQQQQQQHCFVVMMEVLDNLPHDRVVRQSPQAEWQQVAVTMKQQQQQHDSSGKSRHGDPTRQQQHYAETLQAADDPLIQRCLQALHSSVQQQHNSGSGGSSNSVKMFNWLQTVLGLPGTDQNPLDVWLPTRCLQLLEVMHQALPNHTLVAADFDALPDVKVPGRNAPLVSGRSADRRTVDHGTVLVPWGSADIFFPTDFDDLGKLYRAAAGIYSQAAAVGLQQQQQQQQQQHNRSTSSSNKQSSRSVTCDHSPTADFMAAFAEARKTCLLSGYNPLVQDWPNTRVFVGQSVAS